MAEQETLEKATTREMTIHRYSWWKSSDGLREFVVVGIVYPSPGQYEVLERGYLSPKSIPCQQWKDQVKAGRIVQVIQTEKGGAAV